MGFLFSLFAEPLGFILQWIYTWGTGYFLALLIFTVAIRLVLFPLSIKNQKSQADRARLAPRLERIQKKYGQDRQKMAMKQQELYEREGVKMTGGCLPMILQMLVLFSVIAVIYKPLTYVKSIPTEQINTCITVAYEDLKAKNPEDSRLASMQNTESYYSEINMMGCLKDNPQLRDKMIVALQTNHKLDATAAAKVVDSITTTGTEFSLFEMSLLETPEFSKPDWVWVIAVLSGVTSFLSSKISMHFSKASMSAEQQKMNGCSNGMMLYLMPLMSLFFSFQVPSGVAVYWIFSNLLAVVQTVVLNRMWNPAKIRAQAEAEYAERRRKKKEDKERLKAARLAEQAAWQEEENKARARAKGDITQKKSAATQATPAELPEEIVDEIPKESVSEEETE